MVIQIRQFQSNGAYSSENNIAISKANEWITKWKNLKIIDLNIKTFCTQIPHTWTVVTIKYDKKIDELNKKKRNNKNDRDT